MAASDDQSKKLSQDCKEDDVCVQFKGSRNRGGWITFPFISGNMIGTSVATTGAIANLVVYLIQQFNVRHIDAVQIANITNGASISPPSLEPFTGLVQVVVAAVKKRNVLVEPNYYYIASNCEEATLQYSIPTSKFSFLNRAALKVEGDINEDGSIKHPWRLCTVEQVEDLKVLLRIFPLGPQPSFYQGCKIHTISIMYLDQLGMAKLMDLFQRRDARSVIIGVGLMVFQQCE